MDERQIDITRRSITLGMGIADIIGAMHGGTYSQAESPQLVRALLDGLDLQSIDLPDKPEDCMKMASTVCMLLDAKGMNIAAKGVRFGSAIAVFDEGIATPERIISVKRLASELEIDPGHIDSLLRKRRSIRQADQAEILAEEIGKMISGIPRAHNLQTISDGQIPPGCAFLSYARADSPAVDRLQRVLQAAGITVWRDTGLQPGEDWRIRIRQAITRDALAFIACFSTTSVSRESSYQNEELMLAIDQLRLRTPAIPWLIPVRLDGCVIPDLEIGGGRTLASIQRADLFGDRYDEGVARLVAVVLRILYRNGVT